MSASALPQGFSIFQPVLGAQLQFFPAVGTQELDELIHAHLLGPASSQEKRATLALDFLEHSQLTGQSFKFYPVYAASPATSAASSFNTSPATTTWDWSQNSRAASVSSRSSQNRVAKAASSTSRMRTTDFSSLPGMKIMTKDGLDVTNSASRGSKTKEQRDHAHLMRIIKACDSCKRKKIRCDPSHKKRSAPVQGASAATAKVAKKARTASPPASQPVSPPQSISPASVSPPIIGEDFDFTASPFDVGATFSFDALDAFDPSLAAPADLWDEFVQYPSMDEVEDYDFFADPESYLSSQTSDAEASASQLSVCVSPTHSGAPPERGPDDGFAEAYAQESRVQALGNAPRGSFSPHLPYESPDSAGDYADFNLYSPGSSFSEDDRMLDISSSTSGLSAIPSPFDSPRPPRSAQSPDVGVTGVSINSAAVVAQSPFTSTEEAGEAQFALQSHASPFTLTEQAGEAQLPGAQERAGVEGNMLGTVNVHSSSDIVMRTNDQGQLIICCPPGTVVVNSQGSSKDGLAHTTTGVESNSSSFSIPSELSENAVASVSAAAAAGDVETSVTTWLDHGEGGQTPQVAPFGRVSSLRWQTQMADGVGRSQSSRFVHRDTDLAQEYMDANDLVAPGLAIASSPGSGSGSGSSSSSSSVLLALGQSSVSSSLSVALPGVFTDGGHASAGSGSLSSAHDDARENASGQSTSSLLSDTNGIMQSTSPVASDCDFGGQVGATESGTSSLSDLGASPSSPSFPSAASPSLSSLSASRSSDLANNRFTDEFTDQSSKTDDSTMAVASSAADAVSSSSAYAVSSSPVAPSTGRSIQDSDPSFDVFPVTATDSSLSHHDTTGVGRVQDTFTATDLATAMQTIITRTLLATYMQCATGVSACTATALKHRSKGCREYRSRTRSILAVPTHRAAAIC